MQDTYHVVTIPPVLPGLAQEHELRLGTKRVSSGTGPGVYQALRREAEKLNSPKPAIKSTDH